MRAYLSKSIMLAFLFANIAVVNTETTADVRMKYDREKQMQVLEMQKKYEDASRELADRQDYIQNQEAYNDCLSEAKKYWEEQCKEIDSNVSEVLKKNALITEKVKELFYDDFANLKSLDAAYKSNNELATNLLNEKTKMQFTESVDIDYQTVDELSKEIEKLKDVINNTNEVCELGDVTNVKFPLGKPSEIRSRFGNRIDPINPTAIRFHAGVDLKADMNTPVLSIFNGTVVDTGWGPLGGYYVRVSHGDGLSSYYCHLEKVTCEVGQKVNQYDQIALSGNTGSRTTGPHLHFGFYVDGVAVDPAILFEGGAASSEQVQ